MELSNYYYLLNVDQTATTNDIIKSYRNLSRLAKKNNIIKSYYSQIQMAYIVLSNQESRKQYDNQLLQLENIQDSDFCIDSFDECEYMEFKPLKKNNKELNKINNSIHREKNIDKIEELRDQELNIIYDTI